MKGKTASGNPAKKFGNQSPVIEFEGEGKQWSVLSDQ